MKIRKIVFSIIAFAIIGLLVFLLLYGSKNKEVNSEQKVKLVSSNFASYDFLRAITKGNDNIELVFLIGPGKEAHSYDPTAQDLIKIGNADLFVYIGGEMEKWADKVLESMNDKNVNIMCIADFADTIKEQEIDGAEEEKEEEEEGAFDEHIWSSPNNAIKMINALEEKMEEIDAENSDLYRKNADEYINEIHEVDNRIQSIIDNKKRDRLIFGDKMPMQYFINYYNLKVSAAFSGCSTETEPSASTITYLEKIVKEQQIPVVLYIELNNGRVAKTIANETGAEALQIQTLHNVSLDNFNNGETWISLMNRNIEVLSKALQ